ncbi:MAG TPA: hypothetical protein VEQ59_17725 [Polyangiaceae bacterium]|nr:hypothetical protein [Polyangiaceae bacterium]
MLEGRLHQIVVVDFTPTEHAVQCVVDDADQALVDHGSYLVVAALHGINQLFIGRRTLHQQAGRA